MTRPSARAWTSALVISLLLFIAAAPAHADPWTFEQDKSDNDFYFTYDASSGTIPKAYSSARFNVRDKVTFLVYIREVQGATIGERLKGRLELKLEKDRMIIYDGTFTLEILNSTTGEPVFTTSRDERIVLRPKKGMRKKVLNFFFDLPSGDYSAQATFAAT